jgi:tRNA A-37 threonylcarbamoyl transferase component Bud32
VEKMTVNGREFQVLKLLAKGKGGYSYLVTDGGKKFVLKQIHHEPCDYYTFGDKLGSELRDYETLKNIGIPMPELLDVDREQERLLKTFIDGDTVNVLVKEDRMEPSFYDQIHAICQKLYAANLNIDYYPTNFVVQGELLYYIDFECNGYMEQWNFENWGCKYWSKTPEFIAAFGN